MSLSVAGYGGPMSRPDEPERTPLPLVVRGACHHDCPDTCAWEVTVVDGVATRLRGSASHPVTRGTLCPKVNRFLDRVHHDDRVLTPLRRTGRKGDAAFEPISWDDAIAEIAGRMGALRDAGRAESALQFSFAGTQGLVQMGVTIDALFDALGASDIHRELCGTTSWLGAAKVLGRPFGVDPESLRHSRTLVLWGTNTRITNRHFWPVVEEARANGATIVVVDPVRTDTAREADLFVQPRPGTDVALVLGLVHVLDRDGLLDHVWLGEHTVGWDAPEETIEIVHRARSRAVFAHGAVAAAAWLVGRRGPCTIDDFLDDTLPALPRGTEDHR